ncbi:MAG: ribonuclease P protein component [Alphaproteobacteria bacterium]|nr:ribonuclease P protein component [Alphaproteobacteria bacterium]MBM3640511.1 ribonuclease P protein component [Alphaproteobacteria bacterium]
MKAQVPAADENSQRPEILRRRGDFVRASRGARVALPAFTVQMALREQTDPHARPRFGLTVTRKVAGAVERNRIRRRLREALRLGGALGAKPGRDYVFVARRAALSAPFPELLAQMTEGLARLNDRGAASSRRKQEDGLTRP